MALHQKKEIKKAEDAAKNFEKDDKKDKKKKKSLFFYFLFSRLILISWGTRDTLPDTPSKNSPRYYYY